MRMMSAIVVRSLLSSSSVSSLSAILMSAGILSCCRQRCGCFCCCSCCYSVRFGLGDLFSSCSTGSVCRGCFRFTGYRRGCEIVVRIEGVGLLPLNGLGFLSSGFPCYYWYEYFHWYLIIQYCMFVGKCIKWSDHGHPMQQISKE